MRRILVMFFVMAGLFLSTLAWASPSDRVLHALENETIRVTTNTDNTYQGELYAFDDEVVILLDDAANLKEIQRDKVEGVQLSNVTTSPASPTADDAASSKDSNGAKSPKSAQEQARAAFLNEQRELERTGSAFRISGGIVTGVGAVMALSMVTSLGLGGTHWSEPKSRDTLRTGVVTTAIIGTAIAAAGTGLIVLGNKKRRRAKATYEESFNYSLSPQFNGRGGGAELRLNF